MLFRGLSNIIEIDEKTIEMLGKYRTPDDFIIAGEDALTQYFVRRKARSIIEAARSSSSTGK